MNEETYPFEECAADLAALGREFSAIGAGDEQSILRYTHSKYPDPLDADQKAHLLTLAFQFAATHGEALEEAGFRVSGESTKLHHGRLPQALYRWLVLMPWRGLAPAPPIDAVLRMLRGEE